MGAGKQLGIRFEESLLDRISDLAQNQGTDSLSWIRNAIAKQVVADEQRNVEEITQGYIHLRVAEKDYLSSTKQKSVPVDIKKAREEILLKIKRL